MRFGIIRLLLMALLSISQIAHATPVSSTPVRTFVGQIDFAVTGATLRANSDAGDSCAVNPSSTATLDDVPSGGVITAAYLYWAGSGSNADYNVLLNGSPVSADTQYNENVGTNRDYFSGVADVTNLVSGNGSFTLSGLSIDSADNSCGVSATVAGWGLVVIYERAVEPFRTINFFEGFQNFWGSSITLAPSNFVVPTSNIDGRFGILTWEGDSGNSNTRNGVTENLFFDGQNSTNQAQIDSLNPLNNQYNSTINVNNDTTSYGVDFDVYDISTRLTAGDTSAQTTYATGQDRVLLSLQIVSVTNTPATDLSLTKTHSNNFAQGGTGSFVFTASNLGPLNHTGLISISDPLPSGMTLTGFSSTDSNWNCSGTTTVTCTHLGTLAIGNALAPVTINVAVSDTTAGSFTNIATLSSPTFDPLSGNNTANDPVLVTVPDYSASTKVATDSNGGNLLPGDLVEYSIVISDSTNTPRSVNLSDTVSGLLTNVNVTDAAGGTDLSAGNNLDIQGIVLTPGATSTVTFTANVVANAIDSAVISNTANLINPVDSSSTPVVANDLTVVVTGPSSGIKPLYLGNIAGGGSTSPTLPMSMSRTPLTANSTPVTRVRIRRQDNDRQWLLNPATAATLNLSNAPIPVQLLMRRNANASVRNLRVSLDYVGASSGFIGCTDVSIGTTGTSDLSATITRAFNMAISQSDANCSASTAVPISLPVGTQLRLTVDNGPNPTDSGRAIFVYPFASGLGTSNIELPATSVINVDSVGFFDAPFPNGNALTGAGEGDTIYIRSVVSDPFGAFDISAATLTLSDANGTDISTQALDPTAQVASDSATKTYEVVYTIPAAAPQGIWLASVLAEEGTEGTVTHTGQENLTVVGPANLSVSKTIETVSDPSGSSEPKNIPGATIRYTISITNPGPNTADSNSVVVADTLPPQARLLFASGSQDPIIFVDGATGSGLSYSFLGLSSTTDDVEFSNDGGATTTTPLVDAATGLDVTAPRINHISINPKGDLNPTSNPPSLSFELLMQLD